MKKTNIHTLSFDQRWDVVMGALKAVGLTGVLQISEQSFKGAHFEICARTKDGGDTVTLEQMKAVGRSLGRRLALASMRAQKNGKKLDVDVGLWSNQIRGAGKTTFAGSVVEKIQSTLKNRILYHWAMDDAAELDYVAVPRPGHLKHHRFTFTEHADARDIIVHITAPPELTTPLYVDSNWKEANRNPGPRHLKFVLPVTRSPSHATFD